MIENQDKMCKDLENRSDDFYNFKDICQELNVKKENNAKKKFKFIKNSILNTKQVSMNLSVL